MDVPMETEGDAQPMQGIQQPHSNDVLCGRGVTTNKWAGNEQFRSLVGLNKELYVTSTKRQKMAISRSIVDAVRSMNPAGRFLEKNAETGLWSDIGNRKATEKTSQALRDGAATLRKQLSADLGDPNFLSAVFDMDTSSANSKDKSKTDSSTSSDKSKGSTKKGHRRTRSNPEEGLTKQKQLREQPSQKRPERDEEEPLSPKQARHAYSRHAGPRSFSQPTSPQSYSLPTSPHSFAGHPSAASPRSSEYGGTPYPADAPYYAGLEYPEDPYDYPERWERHHGHHPPPPPPHHRDHHALMSCASFPPPQHQHPHSPPPGHPHHPPHPHHPHTPYSYWGRPRHPHMGPHGHGGHHWPHYRGRSPRSHTSHREYRRYVSPDYAASSHGHPRPPRPLSPEERQHDKPSTTAAAGDFTPPVSPTSAQVTPRENNEVILTASPPSKKKTQEQVSQPGSQNDRRSSSTPVNCTPPLDSRDQSPSAQGIEVVLTPRDGDSPLRGEAVETMYEVSEPAIDTEVEEVMSGGLDSKLSQGAAAQLVEDVLNDDDTGPVDESVPADDYRVSTTPLPFIGCCMMDQANLMDISDDLLRLPIAPVGPLDEAFCKPDGLCRQ